MTPPTSAARPRPHRRAARQLLLGLLPVLAVGLVLVVVLALRLGDVRAPLAAATATARATVTEVGTAPDGRGLTVSFADDGGGERTGVVELERALDVPVGAQLLVRYDPTAPDDGSTLVHTDGDAGSSAVSDVVFGLVAIVAAVLGTSGLTVARLIGRPRLRGRPVVGLSATHVVVRQGLLVRSWLELDTSTGLRWLPVHWTPELDRLPPGVRIAVHGDPARDRVVLPVVEGAEVWPSGRLRSRPPRGELRQAGVDPAATEVGLARQARADGVLPFLAPVLGLLWTYLDRSGVPGFLVSTALSAAVLFWIPQLLGSDPQASRS
jgi:hypothetical protein